MYKNHSIAVAVPAYNEEKLIQKVLLTMPDYVDKIIVVDDCSTDNTSAVVNSVKDAHTLLIRHEVNRGVGGAIFTGYKRALEEGAEIVAVMAGDEHVEFSEKRYCYGASKINYVFT